MLKRAAFGMMLILLLANTLMFPINVHQAKAGPGTIYIRADGSTDPPSANITSSDNMTYYFTGDNYGEIVVERSNIVIDGAGYTLQGAGIGSGYRLSTINNVTIKNTNIENFADGIYLEISSDDNTIFENNVTNTDNSIILYSSNNNTISRNNVINSMNGIYLRGSSNNTVSENTVVNIVTGITLDIISLNSSSSNVVSGNNVTGGNSGITLWHSLNNTVSENCVSNNTWTGIRLSSSSNNTVSRNNATGNWFGIYLDSSSSNIVFENNVTHNILGVSSDSGLYGETPSNNNIIDRNLISDNNLSMLLYESSRNYLRDNIIRRGYYNFGVYGSRPSDFINDIDTSNTIDGKPIYYWTDRQSSQIPSDVGYVALVNCTNIKVENVTLTKNVQGILLAYSANCTIVGNNFRDNMWGIALLNSSHNVLSRNTVTDSERGIYLEGSWSNAISGNNVSKATYGGVVLVSSDNNTVSKNNVTSNNYGLVLDRSSEDTITANIVASNSYGLLLGSPSNRIFRNSFVNNTLQVYTAQFCVNVWDNGYDGNYWSNYFGTDSDGDGIGDISYIIDASNRDDYPLMSPYVYADANHDAIVNMTDISLTAAAFGSKRNGLGWNPHYDIIEDGKVNMRDIGAVCNHFNETWSFSPIERPPPPPPPPPYEKLEFTTAYARLDNENFTIYLTVRNTGGTTATIDVPSTLYNGRSANDYTNVPVADFNETTLEPGESATAIITLTKSFEWLSGMTVEIMLHTLAGHDYPKVVVLP